MSMDAKIADLYGAFAARRLPGGKLTLCTACCTTPEVVARLECTPRHEITREDFFAYTEAVNYSEKQGEEALYFAPRIFEFLHMGVETTNKSMDALFAAVPDGPALTAQERTCVATFTGAFLHVLLARQEDWRATVQPIDVVAICAAGGFDMAPVRRVLSSPPEDVDLKRALFLVQGVLDIIEGKDTSFMYLSSASKSRLETALHGALSSAQAITWMQDFAQAEQDLFYVDIAQRALEIAYT